MTRGKGRTFYFLCSLAILMIAAGLRLWDLGGFRRASATMRWPTG